MATTVTSSVAVTAAPPTGESGSDGSATFAFRGGGSFAFHDRHPFNLSGGGDVAVTLGAIVKVKVLYAKADTPVLIKITHVNGADQVVPLDKVLYWESSNNPITAIKLNGTGQGVLAFAGDAS